MFKVTFLTPYFFINKKKNTVICKLEAEVCLPDFRPRYVYVHCTGVAKCSKNDEFDKNKGMKIAEARAQNEAYGKVKTIAHKEMRRLVNEYDNLKAFFFKADKVEKHNREYIKIMTDKNNPNYKETVFPPRDGEVMIIG